MHGLQGAECGMYGFEAYSSLGSGSFNGLGGLVALAFRALRVVGCCSCLGGTPKIESGHDVDNPHLNRLAPEDAHEI